MAALVSASFILLFPANLYSMNTSDLLGIQLGYTNFGYVRQLWHLGLWALAGLTFWTSILNPALLLACLGWCVLSVWRRSRRRRDRIHSHESADDGSLGHVRPAAHVG